MTESSPTTRQLHHAYGRGYFDGKQGYTANPAPHWHPDEVAQYNQGHKKGQHSQVEWPVEDLCRRCHQFPIFDRASRLCSRCSYEVD
jgi:hypothetical protein